MATRQRSATGLLILACLVILVCMAQRVASLHALQMPFSTAASLSVTAADGGDLKPAPCEMSAKTLLLAMPLLCENAVPALIVLLLVLALLHMRPLIFPPLRASRAPLLRIHLINCNFRE
ncbi:copper resistance protein [Erwinia sp. Eh17-17]|uniref:copper resistance protein n=1 Tax=Erwinia sp. Eh17-17 TaxID=3080330 RepID=UPI0032090B63